LPTLLLSTPNEFLFRQRPGDFIADLAGKFFQVHQRAGGR